MVEESTTQANCSGYDCSPPPDKTTYSVRIGKNDPDDLPMSSILTRYHLDDNGRVEKVVWIDGIGQRCVATTVDSVSDQYNYSSQLDGDDEAVVANQTFTLANCILNAYVNLGLIPPHNFDPIPCPNSH